MKYIIACLLLFFLALTPEAKEAQISNFPLPMTVLPETVRPLRSLVDKDFQQKMEQQLFQHPAWKKLIQDKKMTVGLVDLSDPDNILFARVNGNEMMYAASLPKIAILLAAFHSFEHHSVAQTPAIMKDLNRMIRKSDNKAATRVIEAVGMQQIQQILTLKKYNLYDETLGGGLWVGKKYAQAGKRVPEPLKGLSHAATVSQVCRFYYLLAMGKLVSRERSREMLEILINPGIEHKFVNALKKLAPQALIFRKSGTWQTWHSDSVLVWGPEWRRYIAVALIDSKNGEAILRELIPELEIVLKENARTRKSGSKALVSLAESEMFRTETIVCHPL